VKPVAKGADDETMGNRVRAALENVPEVKEKRMFGSTAFMVNGKMCVSARAERIMCRIDPELHDALLKRKGCQAVVMGGRKYRGYIYVDTKAVETKRALNYWIEPAVKYNEAQQKTVGTTGFKSATGRRKIS
jgi:TfoX/Sxy family transcriptional regulator of competence genes